MKKKNELKWKEGEEGTGKNGNENGGEKYFVVSVDVKTLFFDIILSISVCFFIPIHSIKKAWKIQALLIKLLKYLH